MTIKKFSCCRCNIDSVVLSHHLFPFPFISMAMLRSHHRLSGDRAFNIHSWVTVTAVHLNSTRLGSVCRVPACWNTFFLFSKQGVNMLFSLKTLHGAFVLAVNKPSVSCGSLTPLSCSPSHVALPSHGSYLYHHPPPTNFISGPSS